MSCCWIRSNVGRFDASVSVLAKSISASRISSAPAALGPAQRSNSPTSSSYARESGARPEDTGREYKLNLDSDCRCLAQDDAQPQLFQITNLALNILPFRLCFAQIVVTNARPAKSAGCLDVNLRDCTNAAK